MIQVVLFDLGGVLVELSGVATFGAWVGHRLTTEQIWRRWLSSPAVRAFETGRIDANWFADQLIAEFALTLSRDDFLSAFTAWPRALLPGAADLVQRVRQQRLCATLCNTNVLHWRRFVDEMALEELFEHRFASHLIGKLKPDPDVFEHVVGSLHCDPCEILFIDDQPLNVEAARRLGLDAWQATGVDEAERILVSAGVLPAPFSG